LKEELAREHVKDLENKQKAKKEAKALDKVKAQSIVYASLLIYFRTFSCQF